MLSFYKYQPCYAMLGQRYAQEGEFLLQHVISWFQTVIALNRCAHRH